MHWGSIVVGTGVKTDGGIPHILIVGAVMRINLVIPQTTVGGACGEAGFAGPRETPGVMDDGSISYSAGAGAGVTTYIVMPHSVVGTSGEGVRTESSVCLRGRGGLRPVPDRCSCIDANMDTPGHARSSVNSRRRAKSTKDEPRAWQQVNDRRGQLGLRILR